MDLYKFIHNAKKKKIKLCTQCLTPLVGIKGKCAGTKIPLSVKRCPKCIVYEKGTGL